MADWQWALIHGIGAIAVLQLALWISARVMPGLRQGFIHHPWSVAAALLVAGQKWRPGWISEDAWNGWLVLVFVLSALVLFRFFEALVLEESRPGTDTPRVPRLVRHAMRLTLALAVALIGLIMFAEVPLMVALFSTAGALAVAVAAFATLPSLRDFAAGLAIEADQPFALGDYVRLRDEDRAVLRVKAVTWRSTRLECADGTELILPNAELARLGLHRLDSGVRPVSVTATVPVAYEAPPDDVRKALHQAALTTSGVAKKPKPHVVVRAHGDSTMLYDVVAWTSAVSQLDQFLDRLNRRIWYQLQRHDVPPPHASRRVFMDSGERQEARRKREEAGRVSLLARVDLFEDLDRDALHRLASGARREYFEEGEVLVREGEPGDSLYVLSRGRVRILKRGDDPMEGVLDLARLSEGDFFGEMSLLTGDSRRATVQAEIPVEALSLPADALAPLLSEDKSLLDRLSRALVARMDDQQTRVAELRHEMEEGLEDASQESLVGRMAHFFRIKPD